MILDFLIFAPSISSSKAWRDLVAASQLIDLIDNYIDSLSCGRTGAGERGGGPSETIYRYRIGAVHRSRASAGGSRVEFRASSGQAGRCGAVSASRQAAAEDGVRLPLLGGLSRATRT
jgi:hypothetical protein